MRVRRLAVIHQNVESELRHHKVNRIRVLDGHRHVCLHTLFLVRKNYLMDFDLSNIVRRFGGNVRVCVMLMFILEMPKVYSGLDILLKINSCITTCSGKLMSPL